jgi:hypothetical protein
LDRSALFDEITAYSRFRNDHDVHVDVAAVAALLGGTCKRPIELFTAIVLQLAGEGDVYGEKTPQHLLWWRPLTDSMRNLRLIGVVRDPRAEVASRLAVPWGAGALTRLLPPGTPNLTKVALLAEAWAMDQREMARAQASLGSDRFLLVRYEDLIRDPWHAYAQIGEFLGVDPPRSDLEASTAGALGGGIMGGRIDAWHESLTGPEEAVILAVCRHQMQVLGYSVTSVLASKPSTSQLSSGDHWKRFVARLHRMRLRRRVLRTAI